MSTAPRESLDQWCLETLAGELQGIGFGRIDWRCTFRITGSWRWARTDLGPKEYRNMDHRTRLEGQVGAQRLADGAPARPTITQTPMREEIMDRPKATAQESHPEGEEQASPEDLGAALDRALAGEA